MKTLNDLKDLKGKTITDVKLTVYGATISVEGQELEIMSFYSGIKMELDGENVDMTNLIDEDAWQDIFIKFPDITVNGAELHESSKENAHDLHCKWTAPTGLLMHRRNVASFAGKNVMLRDEQVCDK